MENTKTISNLICKKCRQSADNLLIFNLLEAFGCRGNAGDCIDEEGHEFVTLQQFNSLKKFGEL